MALPKKAPTPLFGQEKYLVVHGPDSGHLSTNVNKKMAAGWSPQGGVEVVVNAGKTLYLQAMTRR
jgi:hypothetical protein